MNPADICESSDVCESLRAGLPALFECALTQHGAVRVRTPFMYPDGDIVDVFVESRGNSHMLTDYGDTLSWLRMQCFSDRLTASRRHIVADVCTTLGVGFNGGELTLHCEETSALGDAAHRLGQACVRVGDIWFTMRAHAVSTIADEVELAARPQLRIRQERQAQRPIQTRMAD